jgi:type III secretory pathway component EscS
VTAAAALLIILLLGAPMIAVFVGLIIWLVKRRQE